MMGKSCKKYTIIVRNKKDIFKKKKKVCNILVDKIM